MLGFKCRLRILRGLGEANRGIFGIGLGLSDVFFPWCGLGFNRNWIRLGLGFKTRSSFRWGFRIRIRYGVLVFFKQRWGFQSEDASSGGPRGANGNENDGRS